MFRRVSFPDVLLACCGSMRHQFRETVQLSKDAARAPKPPKSAPAESEGDPAPARMDETGSGQGNAGSSADSFWKRLFASWQQGVVASIGAVMGVGAVGFFLYAPVKEDTVHHTAVVASEALGDARLREQAIQLSKEVVDNVLRDPKSLKLVASLIVQLLREDDTKIAVSSFLRSLFEDHYTQEVTKKFVLMTLLDPWIQEQLRIIANDLARDLLVNPEVKKALVNFLVDSAGTSLRNDALRCDAARAVRSIAKSVVNPWA